MIIKIENKIGHHTFLLLSRIIGYVPYIVTVSKKDVASQLEYKYNFIKRPGVCVFFVLKVKVKLKARSYIPTQLSLALTT